MVFQSVFMSLGLTGPVVHPLSDTTRALPEPLWTIRALGLSLGFAEEYDNKSGRLKVTVNDATRKVVVNVKSDQVREKR